MTTVAIVTGAASGIGRATALHLLGTGYRVLGGDRDTDGLAALRAEAGDRADDLVTVEADLARPTVGRDLVDACLGRWGRIDLLALVAGIAQRGPVASITTQQWDEVLAINLRGPFLAAQAALPHLVETHGSIVAVSSVAGLGGWPYAAAYSASKGGLVTLMRTLALEAGLAGARVNVVCPGSVATDLASRMRSAAFEPDERLHRAAGGVDGRVAEPEEIASVIAFLASPAASYLNGAVIRADGGRFA